MGKIIIPTESDSHSSTTRVHFNEFLIGRQVKTTIESNTNELFHIFRISFLGINMYLKIITLSCGIHPYSYGILSKGSFEHCFGKVNQCTKELRMGELNNVHFTVGNIPWKIFRVNAIFFAVFGRAGEPLPTAQLAALAAGLDHRPK